MIQDGELNDKKKIIISQKIKSMYYIKRITVHLDPFHQFLNTLINPTLT